MLLADTVFFSHLSLRMFELLCYFQMQVRSRSLADALCAREVRLQPDRIDLGMLTITTRGLIATPFEIETGARRHIASGHIMCSRIDMYFSRNEGCNQC